MTFCCLYIPFLVFNPGKGSLGTPYDSSHGIPHNVKLFLLLGIIIYGLYIAFRIWLINRKEKRKMCGKPIKSNEFAKHKHAKRSLDNRKRRK